MLTVYENPEQIFDALRAGAIGYLLKQKPSEKLLEAIRDAHQGGSPMSSQIARKVVQFFASAGRPKRRANFPPGKLKC
jgi:DNA-binding NarL/FixJ family response regulator